MKRLVWVVAGIVSVAWIVSCVLAGRLFGEALAASEALS